MPSTSAKKRKETVVITGDTMLELSKAVLQPVRCPVEVCQQLLNSQKAFVEHQIRKHSGRRKGLRAQTQFVCRLENCGSKVHTSLTSLETHIESSHMKHFPLPCPFTSCAHRTGLESLLTTFTRTKHLLQHFEERHGDLIGQIIDLSSPTLLAGRDPTRLTFIKPPDLPRTVLSSSLRIDTVKVLPSARLTWIMSLAGNELPPAHCRPIITPQHPQMLSPGPASQISPLSASPIPRIHGHDLADLTGAYMSEEGPIRPELLCPPLFVVQDIPPERKDLVRPLAQHSWPSKDVPPPPTSIFYEALRKQVFAQYAMGEGAATDQTV
ncbi:hypothetical protein R3P38DRAFT_2905671 [Favolaschia claudopus]|uniref:C2H2-type domain-containing protein n=1 Tax=Favolaschia claudopus TaxID=2862362 RepID=A0AAW0CHJ3_9AGAR